MAISCAVLMCHAPVVVPATAGERAVQCSGTTRAVLEAAAHAGAHALLPNVEGVSTYKEQIRISADKGQPRQDRRDHWRVERFEAEKATEPLPLTTTRRGDA